MAVIKEAEMCLKPGAIRRPGGVRVVVASSSLPRTIRNRSPRRKLVKPGAIGSPHAIVQEEITNPVTGKKAVGPWLGPFAPAAAEAAGGAAAATPASEGGAMLPTTIYADRRGSCHLDLHPSDDRRRSQELLKAQSDSGLLSEAADEVAAQVANAQIEMRRAQHEQARCKQAHSMFAHAALDKAPALKNSMVKRLHIINQPRRFN